MLIDESVERIKLEIDKSKVVLYKEFNQTDLLVDVDSERIVSTFYNILSNAIGAFSKEITINVYEQNEFAVIEMIDNGEGISAENQARIYEPFFTTKQKSLGLGLTNAQKSIINHKGILHFESKENLGTKFVIKLPLTNQTQLWENFDV
jgi:signal transduction histidine kinase